MAFINNLAYEASAGSGKTFMLVVRYLSLLFKGADVSKILALTFTNKAALEMRERVVETLENLQNRDELDEIAKVTGISKRDLLAKRADLLADFLNSYPKIMTIDSFFTQILRKFSLYASLMPDFTTHASQHEQKLLERFLKEVTVDRKKDLLVTLSIESQKRIGDLFKVLDIFYEKESEMEHLFFKQETTVEYKREAMEGLKDLQSIVYGCKDASDSLKKAVDIESFELLLKKSWITKESLNYWVFKKCYTIEMDSALWRIQSALKKYYRAKEQNFFYGLRELTSIYKRAKKALYMEESELGFSDVAQLVYTILNRINESQFLYFRLDATIEHMLLDEFQDTSILQYKILQPLIGEITSGSGIFENGSFFFVGDAKQSIYRFRGGVSALFGEVARQNTTEVKKLLTNYRSQKEIVEFVNRTFAKRMKNYTPQLVRKGADGGYVTVIKSDAVTAEVLKEVQRLRDLGANLNDIAILCATNSDGEMIKDLLSADGIDVVTETTTKLINQQSVKAILEYLKYLYFKERIYKENFFALIERECEEIVSIDITKDSLFDITKDIIERYNLFSDSFHAIRFLDAIKIYNDIDALVFEYERLDVNSSATDLSGVRVLTIHKSKGLEYKHVIVMDRLKRANASRNMIIYDYDKITLRDIYLRVANRDAVDKEYADALQKEKLLVQEDSLNGLYVAFTRAKENLFIVQKSKDSLFGELDLREESFGVLKIEKEQKRSKKRVQNLLYEALHYGVQKEILKEESKEEEDLFALNFGIGMHYMLEMLFSFQPSCIEHAKDMLLNRYGSILSSLEIEDIVLRVKRLLAERSFLKLTESKKLFKEKALRYKKNLYYIDLLIQNGDGSYVVVDYKSSMRFNEKHFTQVKRYVKAVQEITGAKTEGYLCYLLKEKIEIVRV